MKKFLILLVVFVLASPFVSIEIFAQEKTDAQPIIILKLFVQDSNSDTFEIPIDLNKIGSANSSNETIVKDYGPKYDEKTEPPLGPGYSVKWKIVVIGKNQTKITLSVKIEDGGDIGRKIKKTFIVMDNQQTKLQLSYDINLVAYYGFESEEEK